MPFFLRIFLALQHPSSPIREVSMGFLVFLDRPLIKAAISFFETGFLMFDSCKLLSGIEQIRVLFVESL